MKQSDIEKLLQQSSEKFTPDVWQNIQNKRNQPLEDETTNSLKSRIIAYRKPILALVAVLLIVLGVGLFTGIMFQDNETIIMEINPSIEMITNRFDNVKKVNYLNEDARELLKEKDLTGQKVDIAVENFVDLCFNEGYLNEESTIYIFVEAPSEQRSKHAETMAQKLKDKAAKRAMEKNTPAQVVAQGISNEQSSQARNERIPVSKALAINEILEYDTEYTYEELKEKSVPQLRAILNGLKNQGENNEGGEGQGNSNGNNNPPGQGNPNGNVESPGQGNPNENDDHPGQGNPHENDDHPGQGNPPFGDDHPGQGNPPFGDDHPGQGNPFLN